MKIEDEFKLVSKTADEAVLRVVQIRRHFIDMASRVHAQYHGEPRLWRQCKDPVCKQFLWYVKNETLPLKRIEKHQGASK